MDRPFVTGRIVLSPEAEQQLKDIHAWIATAASAEVALQFVSAILDHIEGIATFPLAGRARDDIRPGLRTTTFKKRTVVAYVVEPCSDGVAIAVLGVFHGGQDWVRALSG